VPGAPTYEELVALVAELGAMVAAQADRIAELERRLGGGFVELLPSAVLGPAVGQAAGGETFLADPVGA